MLSVEILREAITSGMMCDD